MLLNPYLGRPWNHILAASTRSPARNHLSRTPSYRPLEPYLGRKCRIGSISWPRVRPGAERSNVPHSGRAIGSPRLKARLSTCLVCRSSHAVPRLRAQASIGVRSVKRTPIPFLADPLDFGHATRFVRIVLLPYNHAKSTKRGSAHTPSWTSAALCVVCLLNNPMDPRQHGGCKCPKKSPLCSPLLRGSPHRHLPDLGL